MTDAGFSALLMCHCV